MQRAAWYVKPHHLANIYQCFEGLKSKGLFDPKDESIMILQNGYYLSVSVV
jgi:hypothetical protein